MNQADNIAADFPLLSSNPELVYLDSGATTQKPESVISRIDSYYRAENANVHRGIHRLAEAATEAYEGARDRVKGFLNAAYREEIIFTRGTTEGINLVAAGFREALLTSDSKILVTGMEHHANLVPWQLAASRTGARLQAVSVMDDGSLDLEDFRRKLDSSTAIVAVSHLSNVLGTINPVKEIIEAAHSLGVPVLVDAAQSVPRLFPDVRKLEADFLVFSGHKTYGPTGIGVLYGKKEYLDRLPPWQGGGDMIDTVELQSSTWNDLPWKFEAGTPNIAGAAGLTAALDYLDSFNRKEISAHEMELTRTLRTSLSSLPWINLLPAPEGECCGAVSFNIEGVHHLDAAYMLDKKGFALRSGHHCAQPLHRRFGISGSLRASFGIYTRRDELDKLIPALEEVRKFLA